MPSSTDRTHALPEGTPGYETQDTDVRGVVKFLIGLAITLVAIGLLCWGLFYFYRAYYAYPTPASPFAESRQLPTGPALQVNPGEDFRTYIQREQRLLNTYEWENRETGTVRIPIEQAMDLLVKKGLPVASSPNVAPAPALPGATPGANFAKVQLQKHGGGSQP